MVQFPTGERDVLHSEASTLALGFILPPRVTPGTNTYDE